MPVVPAGSVAPKGLDMAGYCKHDTAHSVICPTNNRGLNEPRQGRLVSPAVFPSHQNPKSSDEVLENHLKVHGTTARRACSQMQVIRPRKATTEKGMGGDAEKGKLEC